MDFTTIAYYTENTPYKEEADKLKASLDAFSENYHIYSIENQGTWQKNTQAKAGVILNALDTLRTDILYVDVDAVLQCPLSFYRNNTFPESLSAHWIDCKKWGIQRKGSHQFDSSTMFFKNTEESRKIIQLWEHQMKKHPMIFDQQCLGDILIKYLIKIHPMPVEYVSIFDITANIEDPIFIHYQASRRFKDFIK